MTVFQKLFARKKFNKKPKQLNLKEMWGLYLINKDVKSTDVFTTVNVLYPKTKPKELNLDGIIHLYSYGLSYVGFPAFRKFIMEISNASHR